MIPVVSYVEGLGGERMYKSEHRITMPYSSNGGLTVAVHMEVTAVSK
jgi:hypothetical protein